MRSVRVKAVLLLLGGLVALGLLTLAWAMGPGSSEAQQDAMYNCPRAGKWAISVWSGQDGADTGEALATCGDPTVDLAYYIDPDTQQWLGYFVGRADISSLPTLNDKQGVIARGSIGVAPTSLAIPGATYTGTTSQDMLIEFEVSADGLAIRKVKYRVSGTEPGGGACESLTSSTLGPPIVDTSIVDNSFSIEASMFDMSGHFETQSQASGEITVHEPWSNGVPPCDAGPLTWTATVASATPLPTPTPPSGPGQLDNCPQPNKWAISVWNGPDDVDTQTALATCPDTSIGAAYWLDPSTQKWLRYFEGRTDISDLLTLDNMQGIIVLGGAAALTPTPTPSPTPSPTPTATPAATPSPTIWQ
jgi:hypothetical protein